MFKKCLLLPLCFLFTGCGFHPLLAPVPYGSAPLTKGQGHTPKVNVRGLEGYPNHAFYQYMEKRLSAMRFNEPLTLDITLSQNIMDVSFGVDATATRSQNVMIANYVITQKSRLLKEGRVDSVTSFNLDANDEFSTLNSRLGSDEKVIQALAEEVIREVFFLSGDL